MSNKPKIQETETSELLNKYIECHDQFIDLLTRYYPLHRDWLERQSPRRTSPLRREYKKIRILIKKMEELAQLRMKERSSEWLADHPNYFIGRKKND